MDAELPELPARSFDAIVTRKLTWTLPSLGRAYTNWHRLLKPGGVLVNFDADYCREEQRRRCRRITRIRTSGQVLMEEYERMKHSLRPMQQPRPQWDVHVLREAGSIISQWTPACGSGSIGRPMNLRSHARLCDHSDGMTGMFARKGTGGGAARPA